MRWFCGLKLQLVINHKGSIVVVKITPGNVDRTYSKFLQSLIHTS
ncbi:MAG: hypothetical protein KA112_01735 [Alphaproteobacteria bacterium]|nr:hypothetical protein [Alphaproteobacteria bacterium]MBP7729323.1 hypothetical protein [Alphaproteobacteria bacterium]